MFNCNLSKYQFTTGRNERHTSYDALTNAFTKINSMAHNQGKIVYIPYKIGCGLGGGDWSIVKSIIHSTMCNATTYICIH